MTIIIKPPIPIISSVPFQLIASCAIPLNLNGNRLHFQTTTITMPWQERMRIYRPIALPVMRAITIIPPIPASAVMKMITTRPSTLRMPPVDFRPNVFLVIAKWHGRLPHLTMMDNFSQFTVANITENGNPARIATQILPTSAYSAASTAMITTRPTRMKSMPVSGDIFITARLVSNAIRPGRLQAALTTTFPFSR